MHYDSHIIIQFAERLYSQARWILVRYGALGFFFGVALGSLMGFVIANPSDQVVAAYVLAFSLGPFCAVVGVFLGRERAFWLKLQAQTALCQMQIEFNTRTPAAAAHRSSVAPQAVASGHRA